MVKERKRPKWHNIVHPHFHNGWFPYPSCENGWRHLILKLIKDIEALDVPWSIGQIKEKFGTLRFYADIDMISDDWMSKVAVPGYKLTKYDKKLYAFYYNKSTDDRQKLHNKFLDLIREAEFKSKDICEYCGRPGKIRNMAWVKVLCGRCYNKQIK